MARILIISGSGRTRSNSRHLAAAVAEAAGGIGHETETVDIGRLRIE